MKLLYFTVSGLGIDLHVRHSSCHSSSLVNETLHLKTAAITHYQVIFSPQVAFSSFSYTWFHVCPIIIFHQILFRISSFQFSFTKNWHNFTVRL